MQKVEGSSPFIRSEKHLQISGSVVWTVNDSEPCGKGSSRFRAQRPPTRIGQLRAPPGAYTEAVASREYEVVLTPEEDGGYSVTVPALPGCTSQGETRDEALAMIRGAIELYLESLEAHGDPIPGPIEIERVTVSA